MRSHKRHHNFDVSDLCLCNTGVEDTVHFLFKCPFYSTKRATLAIKVVEVLIRNNLNHLSNDPRVYLYGNDIMNDDDNKAILLSTMNFIKETHRFS